MEGEKKYAGFDWDENGVISPMESFATLGVFAILGSLGTILIQYILDRLRLR